MNLLKRGKLLIIFGIGLILFTACTSDKLDIENETDKVDEDAIEVETIDVDVLYLSILSPEEEEETKEEYQEYQSEKKVIEVKEDQDAMLYQIISQLISKPNSDSLLTAYPEETKLLGVKIKDGILHINLSREGLHGGSSQEFSLIHQTLRTAESINKTNHFEKIEKVMFYIDGETEDTLMGHIPLDEAFDIISD